MSGMRGIIWNYRWGSGVFTLISESPESGWRNFVRTTDKTNCPG
jgi:hypothetical protein